MPVGANGHSPLPQEVAQESKTSLKVNVDQTMYLIHVDVKA